VLGTRPRHPFDWRGMRTQANVRAGPDWSRRLRSFGVSLPGGNPHLVSNPEFHAFHELTQWNLDGIRNLPQSAHGWVDDPALYPTDVCPVEAAIGAEAFLRDAGLIAEFAHDDADGLCLQIGRLDLPLAPLHGQIRWW